MQGIIIKSFNDRTFEGIISAECIDLQDEYVPSHVLKTAFDVYVNSIGNLQLLHSSFAIGKLLDARIEIKDGMNVVIVSGQIFNDGRSLTDKVWTEMNKGKALFPVGFSIGGLPIDTHKQFVDSKSITYIDKLELYEVSIICSIDGQPHQPANPYALLQNTNAIPMLVKMVLQMPEDETEKKPNDSEDSPDKEKETKEKPKEEKTEKELEEEIQKQIASEAENMIGGAETLKMLSEAQMEIVKLQKELSTTQDSVKIISIEKDGLIKEIKSLADAVKKANLETKAWKGMFSSTVADKKTITKMLNTTVAVPVSANVPNELSKPKENSLKVADKLKMKTWDTLINNKKPISMGLVRGYEAAAKRLQTNDYGDL